MLNNLCMVAMALCAVLTLILTLIEKYPIKIDLKEKIAKLKGIGIHVNTKKFLTINPKKIARGVATLLIRAAILVKQTEWRNARHVTTLLITVAVGAMTIGIIALFSENLSAIFGEVVKEEFYKIAQETKKDVLKDIREANEKLVIKLIDSEAARKAIYRDALNQANDKGYVYLSAEGYLTSYNWKNENRLLTKVERERIERCFERHMEQDLYSLMHSILSADDIIAGLTYEIPIGSKVIQLTPYDKIGIIGGYIGELKNLPVPKYKVL